MAGKRRKVDVLFRGKIESGLETTEKSLLLEDRIGSWG
jgi:hypothetical protein